MTWVTIPNSVFESGKPARAIDMRNLRDNIAAAVGGHSGAPVNEAQWHPHNRVTAGDANTGLVYNFAVSGGVSSIVSPDFVDGYEYRLRFENLSLAASVAFNLDLFQETSAAYTGAVNLTTMNASTAYSGELILPFARRSSNVQPVQGFITPQSVVGWNANTPLGYVVLLASAQKITRMRLSAGTTVDGGQVFLDKRLANY